MAGSENTGTPPLQFEHQQFKVYESAGVFVTLAHELTSTLPSGNATLSDQGRLRYATRSGLIQGGRLPRTQGWETLG